MKEGDIPQVLGYPKIHRKLNWDEQRNLSAVCVSSVSSAIAVAKGVFLIYRSAFIGG